MKALIFGCGFSGIEIGKRLTAKNIPVSGTTRSAEKLAQLEQSGIRPLHFDGIQLEPDLAQELATTTHLIVSIAPPRTESTGQATGSVDPVIAAFAGEPLGVIAPKLKWIGYLSTVGVYGNHDGAWMDETADLSPTSARSRQRVRAEQEWMEATRIGNLPLSIFRLSGIYGPGRNALRAASEGRSRRLIKKGQVFNRIHVGDISKAVELAMSHNASGIFNITDDEPAPPQDVVSFAHQLLGTPAPPELDFETAELSPMARSFYGDNKRVSNQLSKQELGMQYDWPNYRDSLQRMFDEKTW